MLLRFVQQLPRLCTGIASLIVVASIARAEIAGLTRVATGFNSPVFVTHSPGDADHLFVVEQAGVIRVFDRSTGEVSPDTFLDIRTLVDNAGDEQGLLGLAFHPDFQENGRFYVNYTHDPGPGLDRTRVDGFTVANPGMDLIADAGSRVPVLSFDQDFSNHNGGWLGFSPNDGYLYISTGDGGSGNDPNNRAQSLNTRLGKILRVDVDGDDFPTISTENYRVPADNPFAGDGTPGTRDDIWSYGLRNPWRASFDRQTGDLWIGDVGQLAREEVNFQPGDSEGGENYGWRLREGAIQNPASVGGPEPPGYVPPVYDYRSDGAGAFGGNAVVGGYVYRGPDPEVRGRYFFGDSFPAQLWTFDPADPYGTVENVESILTPDVGAVNVPVSFGEDLYGNLYVVDRDGDIFRIDTDALATGDYNGDSKVDASDYQVWRSDFGSTMQMAADGNGDGTVNLADYTVWRDHLSDPAGIAEGVRSQRVPESASWVSLLVGSVFCLGAAGGRNRF